MRSARHIERDGYHVIDWPDRRDLCISDLWQKFPELVVGRYLVNTSFDSGFLTLSDSEHEDGWRMIGHLAHSPKIRSTDQIPHDQYDEWLVFDQPIQINGFETMINHGAFSPIDFGCPFLIESDFKAERFHGHSVKEVVSMIKKLYALPLRA